MASEIEMVQILGNLKREESKYLEDRKVVMNFLYENPSLSSFLLSPEGQENISLNKILKNTILSEWYIHLKLGCDNLPLKPIFKKTH